MRAVVLERLGLPENLKLVEAPVLEPGDCEVLIKVEEAAAHYWIEEQRNVGKIALVMYPTCA